MLTSSQHRICAAAERNGLQVSYMMDRLWPVSPATMLCVVDVDHAARRCHNVTVRLAADVDPWDAYLRAIEMIARARVHHSIDIPQFAKYGIYSRIREQVLTWETASWAARLTER